MKPSEYSHVAVLRLAHPDAPSLREVGRRVGLSATALSQFERGIVDVSPEKLVAYAKALDLDPEVVLVRWLQQSLAFHLATAEERRSAIRSLGQKSTRGGRPKPGRKGTRLVT